MKLFLVPTPIGNLEDITFRAIRILKEADLILAEDTRTSGVLLKHYDIQTQMKSYHQHNEHGMLTYFVEEMQGGKTIALITDRFFWLITCDSMLCLNSTTPSFLLFRF